MSIPELTAIFGWMLVINLLVYTFSAAVTMLGRGWVSRLEARFTGVPPEKWPQINVDYLSRYKVAIIMLNLAPYMALRIVG